MVIYLPEAQVRDPSAHKSLGRFMQNYSAIIPAHGSKMLKVSGRVDWKQGVVSEAEWPGNLRKGGTRLLGCKECSQGFSVRIGVVNGQREGALTFRHLEVAQAGRYKVELTYVQDGLGDKAISVQVNNAPPFHTELVRVGNSITIPVDLHAGDNSMAVSYSGNGRLNVDKIRLFR